MIVEVTVGDEIVYTDMNGTLVSSDEELIQCFQ